MNRNVEKARRHSADILRQLDAVERDLKSSRNWGIFDLLGGKGFVSYLKHRKLNKAERRLKRVAREIKILQRELDAIPTNIYTNINTGIFSKFLDIFLDNSLADWYVQFKIHDALDEVRYTKQVVRDINRDLTRISKRY